MLISVIGTSPLWMMKFEIPQHDLLVASSSPEGDVQEGQCSMQFGMCRRGIAYVVYIDMLCPVVVLMACQLQCTWIWGVVYG